MIGTHLILVPQEEVMEVAQWGILHDHSRVGHFRDTTHHPDDIGVGSCRDLHHYCQLRVKVVQFQPHPLPWVESVREGTVTIIQIYLLLIREDIQAQLYLSLIHI